MSSIRLQQPAQTQQHSVGPMEQIAPTHDDDAVAERFKKFRPRLSLARGSREIDDECVLGAQVIDDEWPDLAIADEAVMTQRSRLEQLRECVICRIRGALANEHFRLGSIAQDASEHAATIGNRAPR